MTKARLAGVVLVAALTLAAAAVGSASASAKPNKLLLSAGGTPLPVGLNRDDPFHITTTSPVHIFIPAEERTLVCPPANEVGSLQGWAVSNDKRTDTVRFAAESGLDEPHHCSGTVVAGRLLLGKLKLSADGTGREIPIPSESARFQVLVGSCSFTATSMSASFNIGGPLEISFKGTFTSDEAGCATEADVEAGPFKATFESQPVEATLD